MYMNAHDPTSVIDGNPVEYVTAQVARRGHMIRCFSEKPQPAPDGWPYFLQTAYCTRCHHAVAQLISNRLIGGVVSPLVSGVEYTLDICVGPGEDCE